MMRRVNAQGTCFGIKADAVGTTIRSGTAIGIEIALSYEVRLRRADVNGATAGQTKAPLILT